MKGTIEISADEYAHLLSQSDIILNLSEEVHRLNDIINHLIGDRNMKKDINDVEEMKNKIEHRVARTRVSDFDKLRDYDATNELHRLLKQGFHVVYVNKIGGELEYIVERLV